MKRLIVLFLAACGSAPTPSDAPETAPIAVILPADDVTVSDVAALALTDRVVVDVRTDAEWARGHVPGAVHIPLDTLESRLSELEPHRDGPIYAICQSGGRSARAADILARNGFTVHNVTGGTSAWMAAGHPVE